MKERSILIIGLVFILFVFFVNTYSISGNVVDASHRYCSDSDKGIKPYSAGFASSDIGNFYDRCFSNLNEIREYYCTEGRYGGNYQVESKVIRCGEGFNCVRDVSGKADACVKS